MTELGHNNPPASADPLVERLAATYEALLARRDELLAAAKRAPEATDATSAAKLTDFAKILAEAEKVAETARKREKDDYLRAGRTVDRFFASLTEPLAAAREKVKAAILAWEVRAEARQVRGEYGAIASLKTFLEVTDFDRAELDLEALRPYLEDTAIRKAIRAFIRAGGRELKGADIETIKRLAVS